MDGRADQYALACVAYQLLTGVAPFERDQGMAVLLAHLSEPPPSAGLAATGPARCRGSGASQGAGQDPGEAVRVCRDFADALREALGLAPYSPRGSASAPGHPHTQITPRPELSEPTTAGRGRGSRPG